MEQEHDQPESQYHTLFRQYDAVLGRWWSNDPEQERYASFSPYVAMGANPVNYVDPDGNFEFAKVGDVSKGGRSQSFKQEYDIIANGKHLVPIVKNIKNYVVDNPRILDALVRLSPYTSDKILKDLEYDQGPKLFVVNIVQDGFEVDGDILIAKRLHNNPEYAIDNIGTHPEEYTEELLLEAAALELYIIATILHEYGHKLGLKDDGNNSTYQLEKEMFGLEGDFNSKEPPKLDDYKKAIKNKKVKPMKSWEKLDEDESKNDKNGE